MKKYALFIGRFQPLHGGHRYLFSTKIAEGIPVCIAIRDVEVDENNPWYAQQIKEHIESELSAWVESGMLKVIIIPDIEGVYYGRGVGYKVEEIVAPKEIQEISATKIRKSMGI